MIIRMKQLVARVGMSESTIRREIEAGNFPYSIAISKRLIGWRSQDIEAWEASRV